MSQSTEQALNSNPAAVDPLVSRPLFESLQDSNNIDYKPTHDAIGTIGTPIAKTSSSSNTIDLVASATPTTNQSNIISYTPHKSNQAQIQTPARGNPLTPPTSDEKPHIHLPAFELNSPANAVTTNSGRLERVDSMAERIAAQSARYSHSIQRSNLGSATDAGAPEGHNTNQLSPSSDGGKNTIQFPSSPSTELHSSSGPGGRPQFMGTFASPAGRHPLSVPHLTYHQLQQQQQQQHRLQHPQVSPSKSLPSFPPTTYTPVELPIGTDVGSPLNKTQDLHRSRGSSDGSRRIPSITKADPLDNPCNTANVYINGLPLRFTDDELYRLTRGFGAVKSVKMFTRHLEDKPSAYGFVLFNRVEDAERFIITLRQHTPFHPSFAKTNKVPSTANAKDAMKDPIIPLPANGDYADISITGLPLNLDMQTLRALLAPQAIKQSRFFHTTGFPRRLVGFIRMESKQAAEDVIERLHDSNVLGWTEKLSVTMINHGSNRHDSFNHNPMSINQQAGSLGSPFLRQEQQHENNMQGHRRFSSMGNFQPMHQSNGSEQDLAHLVGGMNLDKRGRAPSLGMAGRLSNQSNTYESRDMYNPRLIQQLAELQILRMQQQPGQGSFSSKIPTGLDFGRPRSGSGGSMLGSGRQFQGSNLPPSATSGVTRNGGVPFSLPGLSPSQPDSPEGSMSSEPSPTTPVFQMHRALRTSMNSIGEH